MTSIEANRFNAIVVLDSIPPDQLQSARRLAENIEAIGAAYPPAVSVERIRIGGLEDFFAAFDRLRARTSVDGFMPLLHFECHGSEDGFELSDGSFIEWAKLKEPLTQLNIVTGLNLMVCVAACTGGALLKVVTALDRAPLWGVTSTGRCNTLPCWTEVECYATTNEAPVLHRRRERGDLVSMA